MRLAHCGLGSRRLPLDSDVLNMRFIFVGERTQGADHRIRRRLTQAAQGWCSSAGRRVLPAAPNLAAWPAGSVMRLKHAMHLVGPNAAGNALSARLRHAEIHEVLGHIDHAGAFVHHDHSAGSHDGAGFGERFIVDWHVEEFGRQASAGRTASLHRFEFPALGNAAANFENHFAQGYAHGHFHQAGVLHAPRQRENFGAFALFRADLRVPVAAIANDGRERWHRFRRC